MLLSNYFSTILGMFHIWSSTAFRKWHNIILYSTSFQKQKHKRNAKPFFYPMRKANKRRESPKAIFFQNWQEILLIKLWKPTWDLHTRVSKLVFLMQSHSRIHWTPQGKLAVNICFGISWRWQARMFHIGYWDIIHIPTWFIPLKYKIQWFLGYAQSCTTIITM